MKEIEISKKQYKFFQNLSNSKIIFKKLEILKRFKLENIQLDIKQMKGKWHGFYRLRIGDIRIIFYEKNKNS